MIHFGHESVGGFMRGRFRDQGGLFSYLSPEARVPAKHPLRQVRELVRAVLKDLSPSFGKLYSSAGRPSIPPEQLLSALLLQVFYGIRSERQLMVDYNLLYRWFAGLAPDDPRAINVTPHVAQNNGPAKIGKRRRSSIDARTTRHASYGMSQKRRKMIECIFGWGKQHGTMRKAKHRGVARIAGGFLLNLIAYNLIRIPKLVAA